MAVPMQRPTSAPLDGDVARQLRQMGKAIAALQRRVDELDRRSAEVSAAEAVGKLRNLLRVLASEPVEDGRNHPAEVLLRGYWEEHPDHLSWSEALEGAERPGLFADFLRLAGRVRPSGKNLRDRILEDGLASASVEVRDAAVQAAELWADSSAAAALARHHEDVPWLADYIDRVRREIGSSDRAGS